MMKVIIKKLIGKGFFHIFSANVINKIFQFCNGIFLVRLLSKSEFGSYSYAQNILNLFLLFNGLGVLYALLQFGSEKIKKRNVLYKFGFKIGICFNLLITIAIILYSIYADFPNNQSKLALLIMAFMPFSIFGFEFIQNYLRSGLHNIEFSKLSSLNTFLIFVFSVLGAFIYGLIGVIFGQYLAYIISILIGFRFILNNKHIEVNHNEKINKIEKKEFMEYSIVSMLSNAVSQVVYLIDVFLIGVLISDADLIAAYKTATLIPFALNFIPLSVMTFVYPYFAKNKDNIEWVKENFIKMQKYLFGFNLIIVILLVTSAPLLIQILFGKNYVDSVQLFRILCIGYLIGGSFRIPAGNVLAMTRNVKFLFVANTMIGIINIGLDIVLIKTFSTTGAAISTVVIILLSSFIYNIYLYKFRLKSYIPN